mmetsp:Transcript_51949/g.93407  ORF Transcript_51949/g.93407 Transcript_51949/m.93407 type:complete len:255 (+) Transcript_51949:118-882(+)
MAGSSVDCSLKSTLALKPEKRSAWLTKAVSALKEGSVRPSDVYDIISNRRFVSEVSDKIGKRMRRALDPAIHLFSDKQRQGLEKCELFSQFPLEEAPPKQERGPEVDESKMEDMMARCRAFVRENENLWEVRKRELEEAEERKRREEEERRLAEENRILEEKRRVEEERRLAEEQERRKKEEAEALASLEEELQNSLKNPKPKHRQVKSRERSRSRDRSRSDSRRSDSRSRSPSRRRSRRRSPSSSSSDSGSSR